MPVADDDNPEVARSADALETMLTERFCTRIRAARVARSTGSADVQAVTGMVWSNVFATVAELRPTAWSAA